MNALFAWTTFAGVLAAHLVLATQHFFWVGAVAAQVRFPMLVAQLACTVVLLALRRPWLATLVGLSTIAPLGATAALWFGAPRPRHVEQPTLVVSALNLYYGRVRPEEVDRWLAESQPDVLGLCEAMEDWPERLTTWQTERFPHRHVTRAGHFELALLSRFPLRNVREMPVEHVRVHRSWRAYGLQAEIDFEGEPIRITVVHPERPGRPWRQVARRVFYDELIDSIEDAPRAIVFGDLNITGYTPDFRRLTGPGRLTDTRIGFGRQTSWAPPPLPQALGITLDHVLVRGLLTHERSVGPDLGGDHLPTLTRLSLE